MKNQLIAELKNNRKMSTVALTEWSRAKHKARLASVNDTVYDIVGSEDTAELIARACELEAQRDALWEEEREIVAKLCVCIAVDVYDEYRDDIIDDIYKAMIVDGVGRKDLPEEMKSALVDYVNIYRMELNDI